MGKIKLQPLGDTSVVDADTPTTPGGSLANLALSPEGPQAPVQAPEVFSTDADEKARQLALSGITTAVRAVTEAEVKTGSLYASVVRAVIEGIRQKATNKQMAAALQLGAENIVTKVVTLTSDGRLEKTSPYAGMVARYKALARWTLGEMPDGVEKPTAVLINGAAYRTPLEALDSERCSFTAVYQAWKNAVQPTVVDLTVFETVTGKAAEVAVKKWAITLRIKSEDGTEAKKRFVVSESKSAVMGALRGLLRTPIALELTDRERLAFGRMLGLKAELDHDSDNDDTK